MGAWMSRNRTSQHGLHIRGDGEIHGSVSVNNANYYLQSTESAIFKNGPFYYNYPDFSKKSYVGHSEHLQRLKEWLNHEPEEEENSLSSHTMVVCGMGGAGKTTLIHRFIRASVGSSANDISVIWLPAETEDLLKTHFKTLATMLRCNTEFTNQQDLRLVLQHVYSTLHDQKTLLVFDNAVTDISNLDSKPMISKYFPKLIRRSNFKIIVTSRNQDWQEVTNNVCRMETLLPSEAVDYIEHSLPALPDVKLHSKDVAEFFDNLPIAIESAVDAIWYRHKREQALGNDYSLHEFLQVLNKSGKQKTDYKCQEIKRTYRRLDMLWNHTLDMLANDSKDGKLAIKILNYLAFLSPNGVPVKLIMTLFEGQKISSENLGEALLLLKSLSLVTVTTSEMTRRIKVHRLLQSNLIKVLKNKRKLTKTYTTFLQMYRTTLTLLTFKDTLNYVSYSDNARAVCDNIIVQLNYSKNYPPQIKKFVGINYLVEILEKSLIFNPDYVSQVSNNILAMPGKLDQNSQQKLEKIRNLGYETAGKYQQALEAYQEALTVESETKGSNHPDILTTKNSMALLLFSMGKYEDALIVHEEVLKVRSDILGSNHTDTLTTKNDMALVLDNMGRYDDALKAYQEVVRVWSHQLGSTHPDTLTTKHNIASTLNKQGKYEDALKVHEEVLKVRLDMLGSHHPHTLTTKHGMALVLVNMGKYEDALTSYNEVLKVRTDILGRNHPETLVTKNNMALVLDKLGKYEDALKAYEEVLHVRSDILGSSNPSTLLTQNNMALVLDKLGKYEDAFKACQGVLKVWSHELGSNHPFTLTAKNNMALVLDNMGMHEDALQAFEEVLNIRSDILGSTHPSTLTTKHNMASVLNKMGKYEDALKEYEEVLQVRTDILGRKHPDTLATKTKMASVLDSMSKYEDGLNV